MSPSRRVWQTLSQCGRTQLRDIFKPVCCIWMQDTLNNKSLLVVYTVYDMFKIFTPVKVILSYRAQCPNDGRDLGSCSVQCLCFSKYTTLLCRRNYVINAKLPTAHGSKKNMRKENIFFPVGEQKEDETPDQGSHRSKIWSWHHVQGMK